MLLLGCIILVVLLLYIKWRKNSDSNQVVIKQIYSLEAMIDFVAKEMQIRCYEKQHPHVHIEANGRREQRQQTLLNALRRCSYGAKAEKAFVKSVIEDILFNSGLEKERVLALIPIQSPHLLSAQDCFDVMLYLSEQEHGDQAFWNLVKTNHWDLAKVDKEGAEYYEIDDDMIWRAYNELDVVLSESDRRALVVQRVYQHYKGFSVIDHLREMAIDGLSGGVSGYVGDMISKEFSSEYSYTQEMVTNYNAIWTFFEGKSIRLSFLGFGCESELKRVCQNIYRYNNVGMLSKDVGFKINDMIDGSRVVVVRPDFSESWAFFVRKFHMSHIVLEELVKGKGAIAVIELLKYLIKGGCITAVTGSQGSGKTTLLMALVGQIYPSLTIRIQETAFELQLRRIYPTRNILTFRETRTISGQEGLDLQKKTDGCVNILGEVATDEVAAWMIQMAQVASLFTLFTHHAKTTRDLVLSLRNSLLKCDVFRDEKIAQEQVTSVLNFDIHLAKDYSGRRYIERITEIRPSLEDKLGYQEVDIARWQEGGYVVLQPISSALQERMMQMMSTKDARQFQYLMSTISGGDLGHEFMASEYVSGAC